VFSFPFNTKQALESLGTSLPPSLTTLEINGFLGLNDNTVTQIARHCPNLVAIAIPYVVLVY
jgi:hypothetical protein